MVISAGQQMAQQADANNNKQVFGSLVVNVKSYGAKGEGLVSDTTKNTMAIQEAIDYAISIGKREVTFPAGTYYYGTLTSTENMVFIGDGVTLIGTTTLNITSLFAFQAETTTRVVNVVTRYGADPIGIRDSHTALQNALTAAVAERKTLFIPSGTYLCSSSLSSSGNDVSIQGDSLNTTRIIFTGTTGGIFGSIPTQGTNTPPKQVVVKDITIESRTTIASPALSFAWVTYQPNAQGNLWMENVQITRKNDGTGSFSEGIKLKNCIVGIIDKCIILGDDLRVSSTGIYLEDCVSIRVKNTDINRYNTATKVRAVSAAQTEGVLFEDCSLYDVYAGVDVINAIGIELVRTHVNINGTLATFDIKLDNVKQSNMDTCLLYAGGSPGDALNQDGIQILNGSNSIKVQKCTFVATIAGNTRAAVITSGGIGYCMFQNNTVNFFPNGIAFPTVNDTLNHVSDNLFFSVALPIQDVGTNNFLTNNTADGVPLSNIRWGVASGAFRTGEMSTNASWGGFFKGYNGSVADLAFVDSSGNVAATVKSGSFQVKYYLKAALPTAAIQGGLIYVADDVGGAVIAFSNGTNWLRVTDRAIIS